MVLQILLRRISFRVFLMVAARRIVLAIFSAATSSTMVIRTLGSPATSTRLFGSSSLEYWCWYSCRCWLITLMAARVHVALALRLKLKLWENLRWYYQVCGLVSTFFFGCLQKNTRSCHGRRKNLKTSKICSFSFRLYFVIAGVLMYLYHVLFATINISWY